MLLLYVYEFFLIKYILEVLLKHYIKLLTILLLGAIVLQGFQCSSREMTTAKVAIKNKDIPKAVENLQKEIEKNPKNGEAYILLAEIKVGERNIPAAIELMDKAEPLVANDPKLKDKPAQFKFEIFRSLIQQGDAAFQQYNKTKDEKILTEIVQIYSNALILRPSFFEGYRRIGLAYEIMDDANKAIEAYTGYLRIMQPSFDIAVANNFYVGASRDVLISKFGNPKFLKGGKTADRDSTVLEQFNVNGNDLFVLSIVGYDRASLSQQAAGSFLLQSWSYNPPKNILPAEREIVPENLTQPVSSLAALYYKRNDKDNSLKYFKTVASVDPFDDNANSAIVTIYQELGKPEDAISAIEENVKKNPANPLFLAQLGDIYMNNKKYDEAIRQYEQALTFKSDFGAALRNVAACYGNKAALIQQEQNEKINTGKMKVPDTNAYYPLLKKSAEYFEKSVQTSAYKNDPDVIGDLCGIYLVLGKNYQSKFDATLNKLESIENNIPDNKKEDYYLKLLKIYGQTNNPKYSDIEKKLK